MRGTPQEAYCYIIGTIITTWAAFDARLTSAIWQIGEIPDEIGASVTSQIYTLDGKVKALQAILRVKGFEKEASKLQRLQKDQIRLSALWNRLVHDPYYSKDGAIYRLVITADRHVRYEYEPVDLDKLKAVVEEISQLDDRMEEIIKPALEAFPPKPSPETSDEPPHLEG